MKNAFRFIVFILLFVSQIFAQIKNYQVNNPSRRDPNEVTIAISPVDQNYLAAGANINYFYSSSDGGKTWSESGMSSNLGVWGDPCVLYDLKGNLYYAHLSNPSTGYWIDRIVVQKSTNHGQSWNDGFGVGLRVPAVQDKEWLAFDNTNSQFSGNVYVAWTEFDQYASRDPSDSSRILFSHSTDQGTTFSDPVRVSDVAGDCIDSDNTVEGAVPAVGPNGEVYLCWGGPRGLMFDKSTDGGKTFGKDIFVYSQPGGWDFDVPGINRCNGMPVTACDVSNSPYRGHIYVMWADQRYGQNNTDIFFIKSTDGGNKWGGVMRVNNDPTFRHQFFSWMAVDPVTGYIYIVFYDRRNTTGAETEVYIARSKNGGHTFENFKISESAFTPSSSVFFGDYTNITAYNGKIHPIWMRMDGTRMSVWTAALTEEDFVTAVTEETHLPQSTTLLQNYPNPFNPTTTIGFELPRQSFVELKVYDVLGDEVATVLSETMPAGVHEVNFEAEQLSSGIYFYALKTENFIAKKKMVLLR